MREKDICKVLRNYDIILPNKFHWKWNVAQNYFEHGYGREKDILLTREAIKKLYPDYISTFDLLLASNSASYCNMFIMDSYKVNEYCKWLFSILFYVEKKIDMTGYNDAEKRVFGYLSEILLNVWVQKNNLRVKYYDIAYYDKNLLFQVKIKIFGILKSILSSINNYKK